MVKFLSTAFLIRYSPFSVAVWKWKASTKSRDKENLTSNFDHFLNLCKLFCKLFYSLMSKLLWRVTSNNITLIFFFGYFIKFDFCFYIYNNHQIKFKGKTCGKGSLSARFKIHVPKTCWVNTPLQNDMQSIFLEFEWRSFFEFYVFVLRCVVFNCM